MHYILITSNRTKSNIYIKRTTPVTEAFYNNEKYDIYSVNFSFLNAQI